MANLSELRPFAEVIGADGVYVGTVDHVFGNRLRLTHKGPTDRRHYFIDGGLIAGIDDGRVRLSANADVAVTLEDMSPDEAADERLEEALEETFPASDPVSAKHIT